MDARRAALRILREVRDGRPFDAALNGAVGGLTDADRRLAHELAGGVLRNQDSLDDRLARLIRLGWDSVSPPLRDLLRLGAYQLLFLDRVPSHAAVSTSVDLAREVAGNSPAGFVNAVLRRLDREAAPAPLVESADPVATLARAHTHPEWLVAGGVARIGAERFERLAAAVVAVLSEAIEQGGTTLNDFADGEGNEGDFQVALAVYGREGAPCVRCGRPPMK